MQDPPSDFFVHAPGGRQLVMVELPYIANKLVFDVPSPDHIVKMSIKVCPYPSASDVFLEFALHAFLIPTADGPTWHRQSMCSWTLLRSSFILT
jgi:hypothetical protein